MQLRLYGKFGSWLELAHAQTDKGHLADHLVVKVSDGTGEIGLAIDRRDFNLLAEGFCSSGFSMLLRDLADRLEGALETEDPVRIREAAFALTIAVKVLA